MRIGEIKTMSERTYIVTYIAADGQKKTASVIGRDHISVVRFIEERGGKVIYLDRDESIPGRSRSLRHSVWAIVLFALAALAVVAYFWHKMH